MKALFELLPLEQAMPDLVPKSPNSEAHAAAEEAAKDAAPALQAAIWLYVDDLERSHNVSQGMETPIGAFWHGIMHRREGDFWNAKHWLRQARSIWGVEAAFRVDLQRGFDACEFVDRVQAAAGANPAELVEMQRREWWTLFKYCGGLEGE